MKSVRFAILAVCVVAILALLSGQTASSNNDDVISGSLQGGTHIRGSGGGGSTTDANTVSAQCEFFLAESAIPMAGLGVFTARSIQKGQPAQPAPDMCVYITDADPPRTEIDTHTWQDYRFGAQWEARHPRAACFGLVTQFNSMGERAYASARPSAVPDLIRTNAGLTRHDAPGAGAVTQYFGASSVALRDLRPGAELMLSDNSHDVHEEHDVPPIRTPEWLQRHGLCADHIVPKQATDPQMGRGAFAKRRLPRGTMVAAAPLQIFRDRKHFAKMEPEKLIVNYSFQPRGSTMLLFPYGQGFGFINHSREKANVKLRWSTYHLNHPQWLDLPVEQFWVMQYPGSMMVEVVALRDIKEDEEIFMDYGPEWQDAWDRHVKQWKPVKDDYVYPQDMDRTQPFRTLDEQKANPYASNLLTVCDTGNRHRKRGSTTMKWTPSRRWPEELVQCDILSRDKSPDNGGSYVYKTALRLPKRAGSFIDTDVPQSAIWFVDKPYASDQHLASAFRHPMMLPDDMTPPHWRNDVPETN